MACIEFPDCPPDNLTSDRRPTGMPTEDFAVYKTFKRQVIQAFDAVWFNVPVYPFVIALGGDGKPLSRLEAQVLSRRIDFVGLSKGRYFIVEVRQNAGASALGQLQIYGGLWHRTYPALVLAERILMTDKPQAGINEGAAYSNIALWSA